MVWVVACSFGAANFLDAAVAAWPFRHPLTLIATRLEYVQSGSQ